VEHPALDPLVEMRACRPLRVGDIDCIEVRTFSFAARIGRQDPGSELGARFSIPFAVAALLVLGSAGYESFQDDTRGNEDVRNLARRVQVREELSYTRVSMAISKSPLLAR